MSNDDETCGLEARVGFITSRSSVVIASQQPVMSNRLRRDKYYFCVGLASIRRPQRP